MSERKVVVYEYRKCKETKKYEKVSIGTGIFQAYGIGYEEMEDGVANFSTAIVEMYDGTVKNVPVEMIVFNN